MKYKKIILGYNLLLRQVFVAHEEDKHLIAPHTITEGFNLISPIDITEEVIDICLFHFKTEEINIITREDRKCVLINCELDNEKIDTMIKHLERLKTQL